MFNPRSLQIYLVHLISAIVEARALYSAFALDLEIVACFLDSQVIRFPHRIIQAPIVDLLVSKSLAKFTSQNA